ncbi:hypothetical protein I552_1661 [Mycobacterium xenopi 3993]|nr:hypothetical protein I552_1661 [Mycobacterium xenopi 3993]
MRESLNPSLLSQLTQALRPDWTRTVLARRVAAAVLVVLAGVAAMRSNPRATGQTSWSQRVTSAPALPCQRRMCASKDG